MDVRIHADKLGVVQRIIKLWIAEPKQLLYFAVVNFIVGVTCYTLVEDVNWFDASWFYSITGSTTGYGDMYPKTWPGRLITIEIVLTNWLVFSLFLVHFLNSYLENRDKFSHEEQEFVKGLLGALIVQTQLVYKLVVDSHHTKMEALRRIEARQLRHDAFNRKLAERLGIDYDGLVPEDDNLKV